MYIYICTHNLIQRLVGRKAGKKKKNSLLPAPIELVLVEVDTSLDTSLDTFSRD